MFAASLPYAWLASFSMVQLFIILLWLAQQQFNTALKSGPMINLAYRGEGWHNEQKCSRHTVALSICLLGGRVPLCLRYDTVSRNKYHNFTITFYFLQARPACKRIANTIFLSPYSDFCDVI